LKKQLQLSVQESCHENWEAMTPSEKGRYCGQCQKQVIDFTGMSDRQLTEFFKKPSTGSVCGRFMTDQLERNIAIPRKRIPWVRYFFQFALPAFLVSLKTNAAKAQGRPTNKTSTIANKSVSANTKNDTLIMEEVVIAVQPKTIVSKTKLPDHCSSSPVITHPIKTMLWGCMAKPGITLPDISLFRDLRISAIYAGTYSDTALRIIEGIVRDEKGNPMSGVSIRVKGTGNGVITEAKGLFRLKIIPGGVLVASGAGLETTEKKVYQDSIVTITVSRIMMGTISIKKKKIHKNKETPLIRDEVISKSRLPLKIFPNPVSPGAPITIDCKKADEGFYSLQLHSISGQPVYQHEKLSVIKKERLTLNLPFLQPGEYILVFTHQMSGKKYTSKIIIQ
jgi:CarboxypepD_reg-like domain